MFNRNNLPSFGSRPNSNQQAPPQPRPPRDGYDTRMGGGYDTPPGYGGGYGAPPAARQQPRPSGSSKGGQAMALRPVKSQGGNAFALANLVAVSPIDFGQSRDGNDLYLLVNGMFVFSARPIQECSPGEIGMTDPQRTWAGISTGPNDVVEVSQYDPFSQGGQAYLTTVDAEVGFAGRKSVDTPYDQDELTQLFIKNFENQILAPGQKLIMDHRNIYLSVTIRTVQLADLSMEKTSAEAPTLSDPQARGIVTRQMQMNFFKDARSDIKLKGSTRRPAANSIVQPNFKFEELGIGGLDDEFSAIFRRAFASRIFPPGLVDKLGIQHVRGILLYGPPGTGKTLIARQIGKMLNAREPKVVNGPEVLNKFVGQSEENIRKLFADAEKEYKEKGDESGLHIIIFDELDAVCKQRGSGAGGGTGVGDSVVNQLLSKLDGVDQLNNILLIGMTNRMDMIDEALLRSGRLEVHMEISLPDEKGRAQILKIHTTKMRDNNVIDSDVNVDELAKLTKNFSGAEINGLVKAASSFAFSRHIKVGTMAGISDDVVNMKVKREDFFHALDEVKPLFGAAEEELEARVEGGIFHFSEYIESIMNSGRRYINQVKTSDKSPLVSVLFHGPAGTGKTALAAKLALDSGFPFIKLVSASNMIGMSEMQKVQQLDKVFRDAYKSPQSIIVLDEIELIFDWVPVGLRFSNNVLVALKALLGTDPPKNRRLLVFATTTSRDVLSQLDILRRFTGQIPVPQVRTQQELSQLLRQTGAFSDRDQARTIQEIQQRTGSGRIGVGVKAVLMGISTARQDDDMVGSFAEIISDHIETSGMIEPGLQQDFR